MLGLAENCNNPARSNPRRKRAYRNERKYSSKETASYKRSNRKGKAMNGYTYPPTQEQPATKAQLIALRDLLLSHNDKNAAAAVDNVIDILTIAASEPIRNFVHIPNPETNGSIRQASELDDPRTLAERVIDDMHADWQAQIKELLGG